MSSPASVFDRFSLDGRIALVTGASSGLGRHFGLVLAGAGAKVALAARRADKLSTLVDEIKCAGGQARALSLDVTDANSVRSCFDELASWGVPNVVVNCAGVTMTRPLLEHTEADWDSVINTNLKGCWLVATEASRRLVSAGRGGSIVNIASILGERVAGGVAPYAISKAGVLQATDLNREFLESEAGQKLRARIPSRRFSELSDLDGPLLLLASDAGAAMSGTTVAVDGAHLVSSL